MSLTSPNLDDRDWRALMVAARERIRESCPEWSDLSPGDPGVALIDVFAHLTEILIYRVNRIPEKAWVEFLRLLGLELRPATAAVAELEIVREEEAPPGEIVVPAYTRVVAAGGRVAFHTLAEVRISEAAPRATVTAVHGERTTVVRTATGKPGFEVRVPKPGIALGPAGSGLEVFVEAPADESDADAEIDGRRFVRWREVESFATARANERLFAADRHAGRVIFAPPADLLRDSDGPATATEGICAVPPAGAQVRVVYLRGGGVEGNVRANELVELEPAIEGIRVTNPERALGGRDAEPLERALRRGPLEIRKPFRAITARDYEVIAEALPEVDRAKAFTQRDLWDHAMPGTVEVAVVAADGGDFPADALARVAAELDARRPLGTRCVVRPAGSKRVAVVARIHVHAGAEPDQVRAGLLRRLERLFDPRRAENGGGEWPFGQSLHVSKIYETCLAEAGVVAVDAPALHVEDAPATAVHAVVADRQRRVFYAADQKRLFRSVNDGDGFEFVLDVDEGDPTAAIERVAVSPFDPGCVAALVDLGRGQSAVLRVSRDCGQTFPIRASIGHGVADVAWTEHEDEPALLLATDQGLFRLALRGSRSIDPVRDAPQQRLFAVAVAATESARFAVALGTRKAGVFFSPSNAAPGSFREIGGAAAAQLDVRRLAFQEIDGRTVLWGGVTIAGRRSEGGIGALRWELGAGGLPSGEPEILSAGWTGAPWGSCTGLTFAGEGERWCVASTSGGHVVELDTKAAQPRWQPLPEEAGIGYAQEGEHAGQKPLLVDITAQHREALGDVLMVVGDGGIYRCRYVRPGGADAREPQRFVRLLERTDVVTLPPTWLLRGGRHEIEVVTEGHA